jgi:voltage-gated potassium channel
MRRLLHRGHLMGRRGLFYSLLLCLLILVLGGVGFWLLEPRVDNPIDGLWLAFTTAATVGYGDIVPTTRASQAFAVLVVVLGLAVLSLVTASVAAMFVGKEERQIERDLMRALWQLRADVQALRDELRAPAAQSRPSGDDERTDSSCESDSHHRGFGPGQRELGISGLECAPARPAPSKDA